MQVMIIRLTLSCVENVGARRHLQRFVGIKRGGLPSSPAVVIYTVVTQVFAKASACMHKHM